MRAIILAGGKGTRLQSRISDRPKPMALVAGRPFLAHVMDQLVDAGVEVITLSTGHLGHVIRDHFGSAYRGTPLLYAHEDRPLGTGGGILWALAQTGLSGDATCLVLNGDTFLELDLQALFAWHSELGPIPLALVLRTVPDISRYGTVSMNAGRATALLEKGGSGPGTINAGTYLLRASVFGQRLPGESFSFEQDILAPACSSLHPPCWVS